MAWLLYNIGHPKFRALVIRKNSDDLKDWLDRARTMYAGCSAEFVGQPAEIRFPSGAKIRTGHLKDDNAYTKYQGHEYQAIVIEELTQIPVEEQYLKLISSCRSTIKELKPQVFCTTNPGNQGHQWVKDRWGINGAPTEVIRIKDEVSGRSRVFIPARIDDNQALMEADPSYVHFLNSLPPMLRKAWRDGDWDIFAGQYFNEWSPEHHIVKPFEIPEGWRKFRAYDHGRKNPACCLWFALDYDGNVWLYKEYYITGLNIPELAVDIKQMSVGDKYQYSVADPSIFATHGVIDRKGGETIAEAFSLRGIYFMPASNRRVDGWNIMHQYLKWDENTQPKFKAFSTCKNFIRTIPTLIHDERKVEDCDTEGDDHCFIGSTQVDTLFGKKKIKDLVGKEVYVNTLNGFKKCRSVRKTRRVRVWKVILKNGKEIICTPDHRFLTTNGWKELQAIDKRYDLLIQWDICIQSYLKLFRSLMVNVITYVVGFFKEMADGFILLCGNIITAQGKKDFIFITKTKTGATITSQTLQRLNPLSICRYTLQLQKQKQGQELLLRKQDHLQYYGINQQRVENGTVNTQKKFTRTGYGLRKLVQSVEGSMKRLSNLLISQSTVISIVKCVPCGEEEVYNLTVPSIEHFTVSGGVVVHNCADSCRYFLSSLKERKSGVPKSEAEQRLETYLEAKGVSRSMSDIKAERKRKSIERHGFIRGFTK